MIHANLKEITASCEGDKGTEIGPFGLAAWDLFRRGLAVVPCPFTSDNGKSVKGAVQGHHKWPRVSQKWLAKAVTRWKTGANIGILTGLSRVTVVDVDGAQELV